MDECLATQAENSVTFERKCDVSEAAPWRVELKSNRRCSVAASAQRWPLIFTVARWPARNATESGCSILCLFPSSR